MLDNKIYDLFDTTELTYNQIAEELGTTYKVVSTRIHKKYTRDQIKDRKARTYRNSKLGNKNPMLGKVGEKHPYYKGVVSDCKGYLLILKPEWFTGRKKSKHIFYHHYVLCKALGLTEIPKGFSVHHIDKDPLNNNLDNLALLTNTEHRRIHLEERATTSRKA